MSNIKINQKLKRICYHEIHRILIRTGLYRLKQELAYPYLPKAGIGSAFKNVQFIS